MAILFNSRDWWKPQHTHVYPRTLSADILFGNPCTMSTMSLKDTKQVDWTGTWSQVLPRDKTWKVNLAQFQWVQISSRLYLYTNKWDLSALSLHLQNVPVRQRRTTDPCRLCASHHQTCFLCCVDSLSDLGQPWIQCKYVLCMFHFDCKEGIHQKSLQFRGLWPLRAIFETAHKIPQALIWKRHRACSISQPGLQRSIPSKQQPIS